MARLLPLFPLQLVALPGNPLPLHIFEPRYREMVGKATTTGSDFGIVLAQGGGIVNVGCAVFVETVLKRYEDGRFDVLARGRRRFRVLSINEDEEFVRGEVEYFVDEDTSPADPELRTAALRACLAVHLAFPEDTPEPEEDLTDPELSFRLAPTLRSLDFLDAILRETSETRRLQLIVATAPKYVERLQYIVKMNRAPAKGSGNKPKDTA